MFQDKVLNKFFGLLFAMKFELTLSGRFSYIKYPQGENVSVYCRKVKLLLLLLPSKENPNLYELGNLKVLLTHRSLDFP